MGEGGKRRAQKGAHYSVPVRCGTPSLPSGVWGRRGAPAVWITLALAAWAPAPMTAAPGTTARSESDARKAEEQLQAVRSEIERVTREVSAEQVERDRLTRELRGAELQVGRARDALAEVRHQRAEDAARRAA